MSNSTISRIGAVALSREKAEVNGRGRAVRGVIWEVPLKRSAGDELAQRARERELGEARQITEAADPGGARLGVSVGDVNVLERLGGQVVLKGRVVRGDDHAQLAAAGDVVNQVEQVLRTARVYAVVDLFDDQQRRGRHREERAGDGEDAKGA